jgi:phage terminase large subunit
MTTYVIDHKNDDGIKFYGGAREAWRYKGHEFVLSGPYETGKTLVSLTKLDALLWKYPRTRAFVTRNTYQSLLSTAIVTFENKVCHIHPDDPASPIRKFGKSRPEFYQYPNGSHLLVVGLDNPTKLLSGEFDYGYFNQLEEVSLNAYELALGRVTGRAGNAPYPQVMSDCNPGDPQHWILKRPSLKIFEQLHTHNPTLFDQEKQAWTVQGLRTRQILGGLTGLRYKRGFLGQWAGAEGAVYEDFRPAVHIIPAFEIPSDWRRFRAIDLGYTNPFVCQWWAMDHDGRLYMYREIYMSRRTVADHAQQINELTGNERIEFTIADSAGAEERATLRQHGIATRPTKKGKGSVVNGINYVQMRLRDAGDGKPRLFLFEGATVEIDPYMVEAKRPISTQQEFPSYSYPEGVDGKPNKEAPIDVDNHGLDATRYLVEVLDGGPSRKIDRHSENPFFR